MEKRSAKKAATTNLGNRISGARYLRLRDGGGLRDSQILDVARSENDVLVGLVGGSDGLVGGAILSTKRAN
jgi:hypothetical protein